MEESLWLQLVSRNNCPDVPCWVPRRQPRCLRPCIPDFSRLRKQWATTPTHQPHLHPKELSHVCAVAAPSRSEKAFLREKTYCNLWHVGQMPSPLKPYFDRCSTQAHARISEYGLGSGLLFECVAGFAGDRIWALRLSSIGIGIAAISVACISHTKQGEGENRVTGGGSAAQKRRVMGEVAMRRLVGLAETRRHGSATFDGQRTPRHKAKTPFSTSLFVCRD